MAREAARVSVGSGMRLWELEREGWKVESSCHALDCQSAGFLCILCICSSRPFPLYLLPLPSEPWPSRLHRVPAHGFAPLPPLCCGISRVCFTGCLAESPWPSPSPSNQSSKFEGAQFLIVFSHPTGQAALVWLSGFGFSSGPSQESTWGVLFGSMRNPYLCIPMRKQQPSDRGPSCPFPFRSCTFLTASERSLTSTSSRSPVF